jgi:NTE family protein
VLSPQVAQIGMLEFHRAKEAIEEGERCVDENRARIHRLIGTGDD